MGVAVPTGLSVAAQELLIKIAFPKSLPAECRSYTLVETHLSLVIIGEEYTLKWKKPLQFSFIDQRYLSIRRESIRAELELNRRHSTGVYLGIAIAKDKVIQLCQNVSDESATDEAEWGVWMKTLPENQFLSHRIQNNAVSTADLESIADCLAMFHQRQRTKAVSRFEISYAKTVENHCKDNLKILESACTHLSGDVEELKRLLRESHELMLDKNRELLQGRPAQGMIVDGHGDLRADHVSFATKPLSLIDCIEFADEYREIDVLDELAFLSMDLQRRHRTDLSTVLVNRYREIHPEAYHPQLFLFYRYYRALVRAKVEYLAWQQLLAADATAQPLWLEPLRLALSLAQGIAGPQVIAISGLMGTGKSTLAKALLEQVYAVYLQADQIRYEMFGQGDRKSAFRQGLYNDENRDRVYQEMIARALDQASHDEIVIVDASFLNRRHRRDLALRCSEKQIPFVQVVCNLDRERTLERLDARSAKGDSRSDGRRELYDHQVLALEGIESTERSTLLELDMRAQLKDNVSNIITRIISK